MTLTHPQTPPVQALLERARPQLQDGRVDDARRTYESALQVAREGKDTSGEALARYGLGNCAELQRKGDEALAHFAAARTLFQSAGQAGAEGLCLVRCGDIYHNSGRPTQALPFYRDALPIFTARGDRSRQAGVEVNLGRCFAETGDTAAAAAHLERARSLAQALGDRSLLAVIAHNLAGIYAVREEYARAIDAFREALPLLEAQGKPAAVGSCLKNLSLLSFRVGDFLNALAYSDRALTLQRTSGDTEGLLNALDMRAALYTYLGQLDQGLTLELEALAASEKSDNLRTRGLVLSNLGRMYDRLGRRTEARSAFNQALDFYRRADDRSGEAGTLHFLASLSVNDNPAQAESLDQQALRLFEALKDRRGMGMTLLQLSAAAQRRQKWGDAEALCQRALGHYQEIGYAFGTVNALARLGELRERQGDLAGAESLYSQAILRQESMESNLGNLTEIRSRYRQESFPLHRQYLSVLLASRQETRAFEWVQRAKARTLVDLMARGGFATGVPLNDAQQRQAESLQQRGKALSQQWLDSLRTPSSAGRSRAVATIQQEQRRLEQDWRTFQEQRYLRAAARPATVARPPLTLEQAAALLPEDTALLEFAVTFASQGAQTHEEIALFVVTRKAGKAHLQVFRQRAGTIDQDAARLRDACAGRPGTAAERPYRELARTLYQRLIAPADAALAGKKRLIVCPDGPLWEMPFQALLLPGASPTFLWERYNLVYAYSATGLQAAVEVRKRPGRPAAPAGLLVLADPALDSAPVAGQRAGLGALPHTRAEAAAIQAAFPNATVKVGSDAQESLVKASAGGYRFLHFATHALLNDAAPLLSGIVLARPAAGSPEDGLLTARELFAMNLGAELLVLSACETARGSNRPGEGIVGLTWAGFVAGVPSQVVSQWSVDDSATAQLMASFYRSLQRGAARDSALRDAALALRRDGRHAHPFFWAPFLVLGDWR